jgi:hypothetical protein
MVVEGNIINRNTSVRMLSTKLNMEVLEAEKMGPRRWRFSVYSPHQASVWLFPISVSCCIADQSSVLLRINMDGY